MGALKETINKQLENAGNSSGYNIQTTLPGAVGNVVLVLLSILGVVFIVLIVYAGFRWMLAMGEEKKITESQQLIFNSIIGLGIVLAAYAITYFVISSLQGAV